MIYRISKVEFFKLMKERYETRKPTIIMTNLGFEKWYDILKPKDMVDALLDRLRHRCCIIDINGDSLQTLFMSHLPEKDRPSFFFR
ncbi:MAG: hypothetical protein CSA23_01315 [Deltaproteobacteria bacterium]|nr:MAG: hypothetical protein CSA23_01315 [Deltaproteobacteria bacterium]